MRKPNWKTCTEDQLWRWVAVHLKRRGISTVLVGGGAAAIHSRGAYRSGDLDLLIDTFPPPPRKQIIEAMAAIEFTQTKGRYFQHPECAHLYVEFIVGSLHLGHDYAV